MESIITVKKLCYQAGNRYLLYDINWQINRGEQWVVFGLNGSGKTTLLSILAGYKMPSSGTVTVFGQPYCQENILTTRKKIGWVSSSYFDQYYSRESVLNIVLSGLCGTLGIDHTVQAEDYIRAKTLLKEWNMDKKFDFPFYLLSKGERQNVLIVRALIADPEILFLDEPGTGLDILAREQLLKKIEHLTYNSQITIIYVTHYPEEILPIFNHCLLLHHGKIVANGSTKTIMTTEQLSHLFQTNITI